MREFVALIPDGNRRWMAQKLGISKEQLPADRLYGAYSAGAERVKKIAERARDEGVGIFAAWGGSAANFTQRDPAQIRVLHSIYERFLTELRDEWLSLPENEDIRFIHMGNGRRIQSRAPGVWKLISDLRDRTRERTGMVFAFCLDYDAQEEMERACRCWLENECTRVWRDYLDLPEAGCSYQTLDLLIRTGEETRLKHVNAFLAPYTIGGETREAFHTVFLPDYTPAMFSRDLRDLRSMEKRRGG